MPSSPLAATDPTMLVGALALILIGFFRWRAAVVAALVVAVFEGALRKWVFPEFGQWLYLAKDFLVLGAYVGFFGPRVVQHRTLLASHPANGILALLAVTAVLQLANPSLPNLSVGLFGIKAYLLYVPLMFLVPALLNNATVLRRCWTGYLLLALVPLLVGVVQFWSPADSVLNRYAWDEELAPGVAGFAGFDRVRITGTFSYITGYTTYLTLILLMALSWMIFEAQRRAPAWLYGVLALALGNLLMTGSRGPFLVLGASAAVLFAIAARAGARQVKRVALTACVILPLIAVLVAEVFPQALTVFVERVEQSADLPERLVGLVATPASTLGEAGLIGYGIGTTHQARIFLMPGEISDAVPPPAEGEWERIILEIGPIGFVLVLAARLLVTVRLWRTFRAFQGTELQPYLATALVFSLVSIPGNLVFNHTASVFYWLLAGFGLIQGYGARQRIPAVPRQTVEAHGYAR